MVDRIKPHQIDPLDDTGATAADGTYGLAVVGGIMQGLDEVLRGLTSVDDSVTITDNGDGTLNLTATAGGGAAPAFHGCAAVRTASQSFTNITSAPVQFNGTDEYDTDSIHNPASNNTRFTVPAGLAGVWVFKATLSWSANTNGDRMVGWYKNGVSLASNYGFANTRGMSSSLRTAVTAPLEILLAVGDYIEVLGHQTTGGSLNLDFARCTARFIGVP